MTHGWKVLAEQSFKVAIKVSRNCFHPLLVICLIRDIVPGFSNLFYFFTRFLIPPFCWFFVFLAHALVCNIHFIDRKCMRMTLLYSSVLNSFWPRTYFSDTTAKTIAEIIFYTISERSRYIDADHTWYCLASLEATRISIMIFKACNQPGMILRLMHFVFK